MGPCVPARLLAVLAVVGPASAVAVFKDVPHSVVEVPAPVAPADAIYGTYLPEGSAPVVFKMAWVLLGDQRDVHVGLKAFVKRANGMAAMAANGSGSLSPVRFEGHYAILASGTADDLAKLLALDRFMAQNVSASAIFLWGREDERVRALETMGQLSFAYRGDGVDVDPVTGRRYQWYWDISQDHGHLVSPFLSLQQQMTPSSAAMNSRKVALAGLCCGQHTRLMERIRERAAYAGLGLALQWEVPSRFGSSFLRTSWKPLTGPAAQSFHDLARKISSSGASSLIYVGEYEALDLYDALLKEKVDLPGGLWAVAAPSDPAFAGAAHEATRYSLHSSFVLPRDVNDTLYGPAGEYRQWVASEFGYSSVSAENAAVASLGTFLFEAVRTLKTVHPATINERMPGLTAQHTVAGVHRYGARRFNIGPQPVLLQVLGGLGGRSEVVLPAEYASRPFRVPVPSYDCRQTATSVLLCTCPPGQTASASNLFCTACQPGTSNNGSSATCSPCRPGTFATGGDTQCRACPPGRFQAIAGQSSCKYCAPGTHAETSGRTGCTFCGVNSFAEEEGTVRCTPCWGDMVASEGSSRSEDCICEAGSRYTVDPSGKRELRQGSCQSCKRGMVCRPGRGTPLQAAGYYVVPEERGKGPAGFLSYHCQDERHCPDNSSIGTCPEHRQGLACGECADGMYPGPDQKCLPCGALQQIAFFSFLVVVVAIIAALVALARRRTQAIPHSLRETVSCLGALAAAAQVLRGLSVVLPLRRQGGVLSPFLQGLLDVCTARLGALADPTCLSGGASPLEQFVVSFALLPLGVGASGLVLYALLRTRTGRLVEPVRALDAIGRLTWFLFLPAMLLFSEPFQCGENPSGHATLLQHRSVLCWDDGDHFAMAALAVLGFTAFPVPLLAFAIHSTVLYGKSSRRWLRRRRFLFGRYRLERHGYALFVLLRSAVLALLPVALVDEPAALLVSVLALACLSGLASARMRPHRSDFANRLELVCTWFFVIILAVGAVGLDVESPTADDLADLAFVTLAVIVLAVAYQLALHARNTFLARPVGVFLCHCNGVYARLFKEAMSLHVSQPVFLDIDESEDLWRVMGVAGESCSNVVLLLTPEALDSPAFVAQLVATTSLVNPEKVVAVALPGYEHPHRSLAWGLVRAWPERDRLLLAHLGITRAQAEDAFGSLFELPCMTFAPGVSPEKVDGQVVDILEQCQQLTPKAPPAPATERPLLLAGLWDEPEAAAAVLALRLQLQAELGRAVVPVASAAAVQEVLSPDRAGCLVAVLHHGRPEGLALAEVLRAADGALHILFVTAGGSAAAAAAVGGGGATDGLFGASVGSSEAPARRQASLLIAEALFAALDSARFLKYSLGTRLAVQRKEARAIALRAVQLEGQEGKPEALPNISDQGEEFPLEPPRRGSLKRASAMREEFQQEELTTAGGRASLLMRANAKEGSKELVPTRVTTMTEKEMVAHAMDLQHQLQDTQARLARLRRERKPQGSAGEPKERETSALADILYLIDDVTTPSGLTKTLI